MANTYSALKRVRQERRRTLINRMRKTRLRHAIRQVRRVLDQKDAGGAQAAMKSAFSMIDRAAKWGIIKGNTAARYKSRLDSRLKALTSTAV